MLRKEGLVVRGMQALVDSDLPPQIGLGEMSAWLVGFVLACQAVGGWNVERNRLAKVCWQAREEYAGKPCSLADVQVILWGEEQKAVFLDPTVMHCKTYELPPEVVFVLADTGVQQGNLAEKCLDRQTACQETLEYLRKFLPHLASLRDIQPTEFAAYAEYLPLPARLRAEYVIKENSRINSVTNALRLGKWRAFTAAIFTSHSNLRDLLEVNSPEPERLVAIARELPGCLGARVTAEGQAGCTLNVVDKNYVDDFTSGLRKAYAHQTGRELATHLFTTACGATVVPLDSV